MSGRQHAAIRYRRESLCSSGVLDSSTVSQGSRRNLGDPDRSSKRKYLLTSRKGKEVEMLVRESDMLIVVKKQGNACGAKGHASLRSG